VTETLQREVALLPALGPTLPVPIPHFEVVAGDPIEFVGYRKLNGSPLPIALARGADERELAGQLGAFLTALHSFPVAQAARLGLEDADVSSWLARRQEFREWCEGRAIPLLSPAERCGAERMFEDFFSRARAGFEPAVVHADLGPPHVLCCDDAISGVIDWGDVVVGDPALDFAWLLHGVGETFAEELLGAYRETGGVVDPELRGRALFYHRLGPWYEVHYGLEFDHPEFVESGLEAVRARLPPH
jgi:aminoglycoside phosphotransferase (APT) family kinase protein